MSVVLPAPGGPQTQVTGRLCALSRTRNSRTRSHTPPRLSGVCERVRLFRVLDRAQRRPVTWVCGPPGAGKTTLIASYVAARRLRTLWYQVDPIDADVATFFYYL